MSDSRTAPNDVTIAPIGFVRNAVDDPVDDIWGGIISRIELDDRFPSDCLEGLQEFSHVDVVFRFHGVSESSVTTGARHPRGNSKWPLVGIFAQRAKSRPNRIGVTTCRLIAVEPRCISVEGLDAVNGTPVLDIKPYMREFGPRGEIQQPDWATELMADYWTGS